MVSMTLGQVTVLPVAPKVKKVTKEQIKKDKALIEDLVKLPQLKDGQFIARPNIDPKKPVRDIKVRGGFSSGGGGNAVVCYNRATGQISEVSLLDFVEGLRKDQSLERSLYLSGQTIQEKITHAFNRMETRWPLLARKLKQRALDLANSIELYLMPAAAGKLTPILDMDVTFVPNKNELGDPCHIVRFAVQDKKSLSNQKKFVFVQDLFLHRNTSVLTRAGIIIHEVLYEEAIIYGATDSNFVRWFTYLLSSSTFEIFQASDFGQLESSQGAEFLRGHSIDLYRRDRAYSDGTLEHRKLDPGESVFYLDLLSSAVSKSPYAENCMEYGICTPQSAEVLKVSERSTDFLQKFILKLDAEQTKELLLGDIAKVSDHLAHPDGGGVGSKVRVQKYSFEGTLSFTGTIQGVFGEGDYLINADKDSFRGSFTLSGLVEELKSIESESVLLFAGRSTVKLIRP